MCEVSAHHVAFNKTTNGQTDIKHDKDENLAECQYVNGSCWEGSALAVIVFYIDLSVRLSVC